MFEDFPKELKLKKDQVATIRLLEKKDKKKLHEFFKRLPDRDRQFLKEDVTDEKVVERWFKDFNLNKVAELQGVTVLNLNELANAIKPVVLPGEGMNIFIAKEGKESNQGVGYLDDGTMVVVDNARKSINRQINVIVTSVLQTTAGRMIFAKRKDDSDKD